MNETTDKFASGPATERVLEVENLSVHYPAPKVLLRRTGPALAAVRDVSLTLHAGETLSLVGESGCGKTTTAQAIMRLAPVTSGRIRFKGQDITRWTRDQLRPLRRKMQVVYQDPFGSLNPRMTAAEIVSEPMVVHRMEGDAAARRRRVAGLLDEVGLGERFLDRYPHEFSGGQRQRLAIARALAVQPDVLLCDEPVSALDVSVQAQVLNLFLELKERYGLAYLFVSHDLAVVRHVSDRVAVMYLGRIVELAPRDDLYAEPLHPYTRILLDAVAVPDPRRERARPHKPPLGEVPSARNPPSGCHFHPRCPAAMPRCREEQPPLVTVAPGRAVACHLHPAAAAAIPND